MRWTSRIRVSFSEANASNIFRWEFTDADLGYTYSRPAIAKMANGKWAAIFGNGYNNSTAGTPTPISTTGRAYLYVVDIETGVQIAKIDTRSVRVATPNGLATPAVVDINGDYVVDFVYAGDLQGNMWKFNLSNRRPDTLEYSVYVERHILHLCLPPWIRRARQSRSRSPRNRKSAAVRRARAWWCCSAPANSWSKATSSRRQTQTFYGLFDPNTNTRHRQDRFRAPISRRSRSSSRRPVTFGSVTVPIRVTTQNAVTESRVVPESAEPEHAGFRGEMQVSNSALRAGRIIFTTLIPDNDPCGFGGTSWLMEMDSLSGARLDEPPFDFNNDGLFTDSRPR